MLSDIEREQVFESDIKPLLDPVLKYSTRKLGRVYARLARSGMLQFSKGKIQETVGMFFVLKKNGSLRIIVDTRLANSFSRPPDHSNLPTPNAYQY